MSFDFHPLPCTEEFPLLATHGLYAAKILGDGNCLFSALSDQMYGHPRQNHQIRARTIDYMRENDHLFKPFVTCYEGGGVRRNPKRKTAGKCSNTTNASGPSQETINRVFEEHLQRMAKGGAWGDNMEIVAFGSAFGVNVKIYQRDNAYMVATPGGVEGKPICHIAYHDWEHYSSIRNLDGPHEGIPHVKSTTPTEGQQPQTYTNGTITIPDYQIKIVASALPFAIDEQLIKSTLIECNGIVNNAVDRLLEADERRSNSSQQSSSIDRDGDSSDQSSVAPNKKQDRRLSRASKVALKLSHDRRKKQIASQLDTVGASLDSLVESTSNRPPRTHRNRRSIMDSDDEEDSPLEPLRDGDTSSGSEYSAPASAPPPTMVTSIKLKLTPSTAAKVVQKPPTSQKRLVAARDVKVMKKQAQKTAAKERRQALPSSALQPSQEPIAVEHQQTSPHPTMATGMKTLYI